MSDIKRLERFKRILVNRPDCPNIRRWVNMDEKRIYINQAAPEGKIDKLEFGKEHINEKEE